MGSPWERALEEDVNPDLLDPDVRILANKGQLGWCPLLVRNMFIFIHEWHVHTYTYTHV